ncbi:peptidoglycan bridge formation glycyltransferase FemA/FemB family protein [Bulleidia sp. zg-1006]|uniref:peptidoglycan bridge formation glycyltransferase FemA/FemB family protein n=1 Tax=Bulleidia sp. zg-1006 TaxID=2806552 RepID=UPI0019394F8F|nr:peptidoglycan bridge formation glycyltransferase FemA/FemB family protein [Bulleidia sp. zg-1006]QRG87331.1 peptidoglycan bridge formation glycyltransferase FemA/FemB family protein [Bulleidia sp. zg-1006]
MSYQFCSDINKQEFDDFVHRSSQNNLFQESSWADVKNNWIPFFTGIYEDGKLVGTGLVLMRHLFGSYQLFYLPRGPILDVHNEKQVTFYFQELKKFAKTKKAIAIRFDPYLISRSYPYEQREQKPERQLEDYIALLKKLGIQHKGYTTLMEETTQPRFNACKHMSENYFEKLNYKTRKCIRQAQEKGVEIHEGLQFSQELAQSMHYTEKRKQIALRNEEYFRHMLEVYGYRSISMIATIHFPRQITRLEQKENDLKNKLAEKGLSLKQKNNLQTELDKTQRTISSLRERFQQEGKDEVVICGLLGAYNQGVMELFYMGNHPDYLKYYASYALYNAALQHCLVLKIPYCSFGGIEGSLDDGLTIFKSNWGMEVEELIGEFNLVLNPVLYYAFDHLYPKLRQWVAKRRGQVK